MNTPDINTLFSQANRFLQAGQIPQAIKICKKILAVSPGHPDGYNLMGILFSERKDYRQALHYFRLALKAVPEEPLFLLNTAKAHKNLRQFNDAIDSFRKIITINPNLHFSYAGLGSVYLEQGNYEDAIKYFQTAIRLAPDNSDHHYNLSLAFQKNNNHDMAMKHCEHAISLNPSFALAFNQLGHLHENRNNWAMAEENYKKAVTLDPALSMAYSNLGTLYSMLGEMDKAKKNYNKALIIAPDNANVIYELAMIDKYVDRNRHVKHVERLANDKKTLPEDKAALYFSLGKIYDDMGEFEKAALHYNEANNLHRQHISYNASSNEKYINSIIKTFREDFFIRHNIPRDKTTPCLFIVGMPRSGTTLTERILSMHPRIAGKGESTVLDETINQTLNKKNLPPYPAGMEKLSTSDLASIGKQYIDAIREKTEPGIMTADKMPHNFLHIGLIKTVIPDAKIIHCTRDPVDTCLSCYRQKFKNSHEYSYNQTELGEYYLKYKKLMSHWKKLLPGEIFDLQYEKLVMEPKKTIEELLKFCELEWADACLNHQVSSTPIKTASHAQANQPIYTNSVQKWKNYEPWLGPLLEALGEKE